MSVLEDLRGLQGRVVARLQELQPLVEEYRELEQLATRMGLDAQTPSDSGSPTPQAAPPTPKRRARSRTTRSARAAAKPGSGRSRSNASGRARKAPANRGSEPGGSNRKQRVLALVSERPGITVRELGQEIGVDPTYLYRTVRELQRDGTIKKQGRELQPA